MNVVLDTNCLIMAISAQNEYYQVWHDFLEGKYCLCITNEIIEEYSEVLARNISPLVSYHYGHIKQKERQEIIPFIRFSSYRSRRG